VDETFVWSVLDAWLQKLGRFTVVSGLALGPDTTAIKWANERGLPVPMVFPAYWDDLSHADAIIKTRRNGTEYDARAGFRRNQQVIDVAQLLIAFMDKHNPTPGATDVIKRAREKGIKVYVHWPDV
jgi:hypothetical protein